MTPVALTPKQVADALNVSESTIYRRVRSGEIPRLRLGKVTRIPATFLDDCFVRTTVAPARADTPVAVLVTPRQTAAGEF